MCVSSTILNGASTPPMEAPAAFANPDPNTSTEVPAVPWDGEKDAMCGASARASAGFSSVAVGSTRGAAMRRARRTRAFPIPSPSGGDLPPFGERSPRAARKQSGNASLLPERSPRCRRRSAGETNLRHDQLRRRGGTQADLPLPLDLRGVARSEFLVVQLERSVDHVEVRALVVVE